MAKFYAAGMSRAEIGIALKATDREIVIDGYVINDDWRYIWRRLLSIVEYQDEFDEIEAELSKPRSY